MKWSEEAWQQAEPIYKSILDLPFVKELADGTLSREQFMFYIKQDSLYIENYAKVLAHIASRMAELRHAEQFMKYAIDGVAMEKALHDGFMGEDGIGDTKPSPTCLLYNSYEASFATAPVEVETACVLPCFVVYQKVGTDIVRRSSPDNPYKAWIDAYSDPYMEEMTRKAVETADELADRASEEIRRRMTEAYVLATKMEWMFWESAYNLEKWKI